MTCKGVLRFFVYCKFVSTYLEDCKIGIRLCKSDYSSAKPKLKVLIDATCQNHCDFLVIMLLIIQVFLKVANSSANTEEDLEEEEYRRQMEQLTDC